HRGRGMARSRDRRRARPRRADARNRRAQPPAGRRRACRARSARARARRTARGRAGRAGPAPRHGPEPACPFTPGPARAVAARRPRPRPARRRRRRPAPAVAASGPASGARSRCRDPGRPAASAPRARQATALRLRGARVAHRRRDAPSAAPPGRTPGRARRAPGCGGAGRLAARICRLRASAAGDVAGHGGRGGPPRAAGRQAARARRTGVEAVRPPAPATGVARVAARREPPGAEVPTSIRAEECPVMMLYVVRHAIAEDAPEGGDDAARRLTPDGRRKMAEVARGLRGLRVAPDVVLTDTLAAAVET